MKHTVLLGLLACLTIYFSFPLFGTSDMAAWVRSASVNLEYGPTRAYKVYNMYYPPLSSLIIWSTAKLSDFHYDQSWLEDYQKPEVIGREYLPIKYSILFFLLISVLLLKTSVTNKLLILLNPALIWITLVLGYIDIYVVPSLILAYYFYQQKRYFLSGINLAITFLIKLIPIFLVPAFLLSFVEISFNPLRLKFKFRHGIVFALGCLLTVAIVFLVYDLRDFVNIIIMSAGHGKYLSINAMNFHWLIRQIFIPENLTPSWISNLSKIMFILVSGLSLLNMMITKDKVIGVMKTSLTILFSYAMLFTGAHENHLFPAFMLSLIMYHAYPTKQSRFWYYGISTILFLNLFLFYRFGQGVSVDFVNYLFVDSGMSLSFINLSTSVAVLFYLYYLSTNYLNFRQKIWLKK